MSESSEVEGGAYHEVIGEHPVCDPVTKLLAESLSRQLDDTYLLLAVDNVVLSIRSLLGHSGDISHI